MGQAVSCRQCAGELNEPFDPVPYVDAPNVTREDVLQLKVAFDYLSPRNGMVNIRRAKGKEQESLYLKEVLKEAERDGSELTFDDLYRVMKSKIIEGKRLNATPAIMETSSINASCIICPYAQREDKPS